MMARILALLCLLTTMVAGPGEGETENSYVLNPEDVLSISVWERPDLSRTVTVRAGGAITFPPLGDVQAAGLSPAGLARYLEERLTDLLRGPVQVTIEMVAFNSRRITVSGAVTAPGRYSFEQIPGILEALGAAGGLGATADLGRVQIFRKVGEQQTVLTVDLTDALQTGDFGSLPPLVPGDVIYVPAVGGPWGELGRAAYVIGEVARPGAYAVGTGLDLVKVLSLAGGPGPGADLEHVRIVGRDPKGKSFVAEVDVERYLEAGRSDFIVQPGDAIGVPAQRRRGTGAAWLATREILGLSRDVLNLFLISDVLTSE
ncbi:MAG: polysaccharide biosynthesis/export family protein [Ignavibacteriaceae bacterium]|nr:polysaccharide biosynthesis/export family protein [Ignavibacteriaceae bacterium]